MNLYLISQNESNGYDTYDSAVVAAETNLKARKTHPIPGLEGSWDLDWSSSFQTVDAKFIGKAKKGMKAGVICASFNAG